MQRKGTLDRPGRSPVAGFSAREPPGAASPRPPSTYFPQEVTSRLQTTPQEVLNRARCSLGRELRRGPRVLVEYERAPTPRHAVPARRRERLAVAAAQPAVDIRAAPPRSRRSVGGGAFPRSLLPPARAPGSEPLKLGALPGLPDRAPERGAARRGQSHTEARAMPVL